TLFVQRGSACINLSVSSIPAKYRIVKRKFLKAGPINRPLHVCRGRFIVPTADLSAPTGTHVSMQRHVKGKRQATYTASGFQELSDGRLADLVSPCIQDTPNPHGTMWHDDNIVYHDGICAKCQGLIQLQQ